MIALKIGRHEYKITSKDKFMDNGACVQLLTQSKQTDSCRYKITPTLSKRATKEISKFERIVLNEDPRAIIFTLDL